MAILANRGTLRNNIHEYGSFSFYLIKKGFAVLLLIGSLLLLKISAPVMLQGLTNEVGGRIMAVTEYIYSTTTNSFFLLYDQVMYFKDLETENTRLQIENDDLQKISAQANLLKVENSSLREVLNIAPSKEGGDIVAKVIGISMSPYTKRAIIESGSNHGLYIDDIVEGPKGLLGKIIELDENYAKIMLVGDNDFRIPVLSAKSNSYGILIKQNSNLKIIYVEENHKFVTGETIYTSGDGRIFPSGIPVGVVYRVEDNEVYVKPIEKINAMGFVRILPSLDRRLKR